MSVHDSTKRKKAAISLREKGIATNLKISKSTAHYHANHVVTPKRERSSAQKAAQIAASMANRDKAAKIRILANLKGYERAKSDESFRLIVMLHWAEGKKGRNTFSISNCDSRLLGIVSRWLVKEKYSWAFRCQYHPGNKQETEIKQYWTNQLHLKPEQIKKFTVSKLTDKHGKKIGKQPYGCGDIYVCSTELQQMMFGGYDYLVDLSLEQARTDEKRQSPQARQENTQAV